MPKQKEAAESQSDKKVRSRAEPGFAPELAGDLAGLAQLPGGLAAAAGEEGAAQQAARLGDDRLAPVQRQQMASQITRLQGNDHLQGVIASVRNGGPTGGNGPQNRGGRKAPGTGASRAATKARSPSREAEGPAAETAEGADGLFLGGPPSFSLPEPPPGRNGRNHAAAGLTLQRQGEAQAEDDRPTEAEKAAALAAARAAEASAAQSATQGKAEIEQSKAEKAAEKEAGKAAENRVEQAAAAEAPAEKGEAKPEAAPKEAPAGPASPEAEAAASAAAKGPPPEAAPAGAEQAPASPEEDPGFRAVVGRVKGVSATQQAHAPAEAKSAEAQAAAQPPAGEVESKAQAGQVEKMDRAPTPGFDAQALKAELLKRIEAQAPKSLEEADKFKEGDKLGGIKDQAKGKLAAEKEKSRAPVKEASEQAPDTGGIKPKEVTPLKPAQPGAAPPPVGAGAAAPKAKGRAEVEAPIKERTADIDKTMAEGNITDEQLAKSNEPEFLAALEAKKEAKAQAKQAPAEYRQSEQAQLTQAESEAIAVAQQRTQGMHAERSSVLGQVQAQQGQAKTKDEAERARVAAEIQKIYEETKAKVDKILNALDTKVAQVFDQGATAAKRAFEDYIKSKMEAYKEKRYGGWLGWARWAKDKLLGMPSEVNAFYSQGRSLFLQKMDAVIENVVNIIARGLTEAKAEIAQGRKTVQQHVQSLPAHLKQYGQQAAGDIQGQFSALERRVDDKQNELIDTLASKYQEHLQAVDARIEEMKAANEGLVSKVINAVVGIVKTIAKLVKLLTKVLAKIAHVVGQIIDDPVGFFGNLVRALKLGFGNFVKNIKKHLIAGLLQWLTGALGPMGIELPEDIFSLPGIFSLVSQVLGLTWDYIRGKAVKHMGEPVVKALETGYGPFKTLVTEGPLGLWKLVKQQFADLKQTVIDQIQEMVITEVIKAGVKWLLSLFNPVAAFIKAAMAIYELVMFFVEKGGQILELVNAVIDGIAAIVGGAVGGAARIIEQALARAVPLLIDLLARLLGLGGLVKKVQGVIKKVRQRIDKAIDKIIFKAKKVGRKLLRKMGIGKGKHAPTAEDPRANSQAKAKARQQVAGITQRPFRDEKELKSAVKRVERGLQPEGLKSLTIKPRKGKAGSYDIIARQTEDVGDAQVGEAGDVETEIRLLMQEVTGGSVSGGSSYERQAETAAARAAIPRETRLSPSSASQSEKALLAAIARVKSLPGKTPAQVATEKRNAEKTVRSRIARALRARDGDAIFRHITAAQKAVNDLVKQNLATVHLKKKKGMETHHMQEVHEEPGTFPKTFRARVRIPDKWKQAMEKWAAELAAKKPSMTEAQLKRRRRELAKLVRDSLEEEKREQPHRSRALVEEVDMIVTIGELHEAVHRERGLERATTLEGGE